MHNTKTPTDEQQCQGGSEKELEKAWCLAKGTGVFLLKEVFASEERPVFHLQAAFQIPTCTDEQQCQGGSEKELEKAWCLAKGTGVFLLKEVFASEERPVFHLQAAFQIPTCILQWSVMIEPRKEHAGQAARFLVTRSA